MKQSPSLENRRYSKLGALYISLFLVNIFLSIYTVSSTDKWGGNDLFDAKFWVFLICGAFAAIIGFFERGKKRSLVWIGLILNLFLPLGIYLILYLIFINYIEKGQLLII